MGAREERARLQEEMRVELSECLGKYENRLVTKTLRTSLVHEVSAIMHTYKDRLNLPKFDVRMLVHRHDPARFWVIDVLEKGALDRAHAEGYIDPARDIS